MSANQKVSPWSVNKEKVAVATDNKEGHTDTFILGHEKTHPYCRSQMTHMAAFLNLLGKGKPAKLT